jgi:ABC-2 type transport system permease protein
VRKELRDLRSNRQVWAGYIILPILTLGLPILLLALLPLMISAESASDPGMRMLLESVEADPSLRGSDLSERLARLLLRDYGIMYLLMPMILAAGSSALSIVREKEQRTLEPILATPIQDVQLLWAKLFAVMGAPLLVTWATGVAALLVTAVASWFLVDVAIGPTAGNLVALVLLGPVLAAAAALAGIGVSMRLTDSQAANQFVGLVIVPAALLLAAGFGRPAMMSPLAGLAGTVVGVGLCALLFRRALRRLRREELLTRWR